MQRPPRNLPALGPGLLMAATGMGIGDLVAATAAGARHGVELAWAIGVAVLLKFAITEAAARWQLATGTSLLEAWSEHLGRGFRGFFFIYLFIWSLVAGAAVIGGCGLAAHALVPRLSVAVWGTLHSLLGVSLVLVGGYAKLERATQCLVGVMVVALGGGLLALGLLSTPPAAVSYSPAGLMAPLSLIGAIGGSLTLLCHGQWIRERKWTDLSHLRMVRVDLAAGYLVTAMVALAALVLAARLLPAAELRGEETFARMAQLLSLPLGPIAEWVFLVGFWAVAFGALLGTWHGVPALFVELALRGCEARTRYRGRLLFLIFLSLAPLLLVFTREPVGLVLAFTIVASLFLPLMSVALLVLNNRREWVGDRGRNGILSNVVLVSSALLFGYLGTRAILSSLF